MVARQLMEASPPSSELQDGRALPDRKLARWAQDAAGDQGTRKGRASANVPVVAGRSTLVGAPLEEQRRAGGELPC
jgi:hypothetical protein